MIAGWHCLDYYWFTTIIVYGRRRFCDNVYNLVENRLAFQELNK